jgi:hypothetical protein
VKKPGFALSVAAVTALALWLTTASTDRQPGAVAKTAPTARPAATPIAPPARAQTITGASGATRPTAVLVSNGTGLVPLSLGPDGSARPTLSISCDADSCSARGWGASMDDARAMLERIANRSVRIEVAVDLGQRCQVQRETIPAREPLVAGLEHPVR